MSVSRVVFTYVNGRQIFTVPPGYNSNIRYHCWGGGGGAGGASGSNSGGNGSAGGYTTGTFLANVGDEIEVCVGGGGQQGLIVNSGRKIASAEIPGLDARASSNTGCFGWVPNETGDQYYPRYGDQLVIRRWETWTSFMNTYAVWPNNSFVGPSEENWDNQIWFPRDGDYYFTIAADNEARFYLDGELLRTTINTWNKPPDTFKRRITRGQHTLRIQGFNYGVSGTNPQGVACTIEASSSYLVFNPGNADFRPPEFLNMVWNTRLGQSVDLTSSVPVWAAPLCTFYQPTTDNYEWGGFSAGRNFAFVSDTNTWTAQELARLNFNVNNIYSISRPVLITGVGDVDHFITSGYYKFKRGETWDLARYNWLGDPFNTVRIPFDKKVPNAWFPKQSMTYSQANRQRNQQFATWDLPVPGPDEIYVVGYIDGQIRAPATGEGRGSNNLRWQVNLTDGNDYGGGDAGRAALNVGAGQLNFYGGWGGQQGGQVIAGGGGGGGGASTINILNPTQETVSEPVVGLTARWYQNLVVTGERGRSQTYQAVAVDYNPLCLVVATGGGPVYGWYTRTATAQTSAIANVRELIILWDGEVIFDGLPETLTNPFVVDGYAYYAVTRRGSRLGWCINGDCGTCTPPDADFANSFDIYRVAGNGTWYNDVVLTNSDLTITNQSKGTMPGTTKPATLRSASVASEVSVATQPVFNLSGLVGGQPTSFTLEAWVYATGPGSGSNGGMIMNKDFEYEFARLPNGRIQIAVDWGQGAADSLPGSGWMYTDYFLPLNEAHLLSVVFEGTDCRLYVDGNLEWSAAIDGFLSGGTSGTRRFVVYRNTPVLNNRRFYVGTRPSKNQNWDGWITDVRLWNVARTQAQIQASLDDIRAPVRRVRSSSNITAAAGGGGGGGAGSDGNGQDATARYQAFDIVNPNSKTAGEVGGFTPTGGTGGGGGGGGGANGGRSGRGGTGVGQGGQGAAAGQSGIMVNLGGLPTAQFVMVGKGGFGGAYGGGGGGGGDVITGTVQLRKTQRIDIGGAGDRGGEWEGVTAIRFNDTEYIAAGAGGRGGEDGSPWGKGQGQPGGCEGESRTPIWGGSGGGGGVGSRNTTAAGGKGSQWSGASKAPGKLSLSNNGSGGSSAGNPSRSSGGGGGAAGNGQNGETAGKAGNGGNGRTVTVGGKSYTLGAGGGGAAGKPRPGIQFAGLGGRGGGGDGESGQGNGIEYTVPGDYSFTVPRGVTSITFEGVGGGGGGGTGAPRGNGGGGSGGSLSRTAVTVYPGARVSLTVGRGGKSGENGTSTTIRVFDNNGSTAENIVLSGGRAGTSSPSDTPRGGAGGAPNGNAGEDGGKPLDEWFYSGYGANSPYGSGGKDASTKPKDDKESKTPGNADGYGAGGGGGYSGRAGGLGSGGFIRLEWAGVDSKSGLPNTGSGGGGGFDDFGGEGGTGFCAIAYAGAPLFRYVVNNRDVPPIQQNGYTIHECQQGGELVYLSGPDTGEIREGNGTVPAGTGVTGYIDGAGTGGFGRDPAVYPVQSFLYPQFLNNHGVWERDPNASTFDRDFEVVFPTSTEYVITCYADNGAQVIIDGGIVLDLTPATRDNGTYWWKNGLTTTRSIRSGRHTVSWRATSLGTTGALGLTIAPANNPGLLVFDSRRPPVTGGSGNGGNGLVILEFPIVEGASQVKVLDNNGVPVWRKITGTWIKVGGVWKVVQASWVKVGGVWRSLFGALGINSDISTDNFGGPPRPDNKADVTCIAVVDETDRSQSDAAFDRDWATFRSNYPRRPFWLLVPPYPGLSVYVPKGFEESNLGFGPVEVNRDRGVPANASDWFTITGCDRLKPGSKVALSIDVSGSLTRANVQASINLFVSKCLAAKLNLVLNSDFPKENYIAPFNRSF